MAITWSPWVSGGGNAIRVGVEATTNKPSHTSTNITVTYTVWTQNQKQATGGETTISLTGSVKDTITFNNTSGTAASKRGTFSATYTYPSGSYGVSPSKWQLTAEVTKSPFGRPKVSVQTWVTPRPYAIPTAVNDLRAVRINDTTTRLTFTRRSTLTAPWQQLEVQRLWAGDKVWRKVATVNAVSGTFNSWTDTTNQTNKKVTYRVRPVNSAGAPAWSTANVSPTFFTSPARPSNVTAKWVDADGNAGVDYVQVNWTRNVAYPDYTQAVQRQHSTDGGRTWSVWTTFMHRTVSGPQSSGNLPSGVWSTVDLSPPSALVRYRVGANSVPVTIPAGGPLTSPALIPALGSGWTVGDALSVPRPPLAPSIVEPSNESLVDASREFKVIWRHNTVPGDTAQQTRAKVEFSTDNGVTWSTLSGLGEVVGSLQALVIQPGTFANGLTVLWRVTTKGPLNVWSPVTQGRFTTTASPVIAITEPTVVSGRPFDVVWTFSMAAGFTQTRWKGTLYGPDGSGGTIAIAEGGGTGPGRVWSINLPLYNSETYTVTITAWGQNLESNTDSRSFTTNLIPPDVSEVTARHDEPSGTVVLGLLFPSANHNVVEADVQRRIDGGEWVTIISGMSVEGQQEMSLLDLLPGLNNVNDYRLLLTTDSGGYAFTPVVSVPIRGFTDSPHAFLNWGEDMSAVERATCEPKVSESTDRTRRVHQMLGRRDPLLLVGEQRSRVVEVSLNVNWPSEGCDDTTWETTSRRGTTPRDGWLEAGREAVLVCYRDWQGRRVFGRLSEVSADDLSHQVNAATISFSVTQTHHVEGQQLRDDAAFAWVLPDDWLAPQSGEESTNYDSDPTTIPSEAGGDPGEVDTGTPGD